MFRRAPLSLISTLCLALVMGSSLFADEIYAPFTEDGVEWRGDQKHPQRIEGFPDQGPWVYGIKNFRWIFHRPYPGTTQWRAEFSEVRIDTSKVTGISVLWSPFFPRVLAGHVAMLFHTDDGLALTGMDRFKPGLPRDHEGFVMSVEARIERGGAYSMRKGIMGEHPLVYSLSTMKNYKQRCIDVYQGELQRWQLDVTPAEARWIARKALDESLVDNTQTKYWLTRRSCATELIDILIMGLRQAQVEGSGRDLGPIEELEKELAETRAQDASRLEAFQAWAKGAWESTLKVINPVNWYRAGRDALGLSRDSFTRTTPNGILINFVLSLPAQIPGALYRRGLLPDTDPDEEWKYEEED